MGRNLGRAEQPQTVQSSPSTDEKLKPTPRREVKGYKRNQELLESGWWAALEVAVVDDGIRAASRYVVRIGWINRKARARCTESTSCSRRGETAGHSKYHRGGVWGQRDWNASWGSPNG